MKEFIDKLISRLEEKEKTCHDMALDEIMNNGHSIDVEHLLSQEDTYGNIIRIVNKLAEEYNKENDDTDYANIELYNFWLKHQWNLCSEKQPPKPRFKEDSYLIQESDVIAPYSAYWDGKCWTDVLNDKIDNVIAWMHLPESYTEGE